MDTHRIERVILEEVQEVIDSRMSDVRFSLKNALRRVYWPAYQENLVPEAIMQKLDSLVDLAFNTTRRHGPEDESWPELDKEAAAIIQAEIQVILKLPTEKKR